MTARAVRLGAVPPRASFQQRLTVLTGYTWSNFKEKVTRLNDTDADYEERFQETHLPHRLVINGIWSCRSAAAGRFASERNPLVNAFIGNWSVSAIWNWQSAGRTCRSATSTTTATSPS